MEDRARANPKIEWMWNTVVTQVNGADGKVTGIRVKNLMTGTEADFTCTGVFVAIGHEPNTKFLGGQLAVDANGYLKVKPGTARTSIRGVFAAGDVQDSVYRQAIVQLGVDTQTATSRDQIQQAATRSLDTARSQQSGVSLDEEMTRVGARSVRSRATYSRVSPDTSRASARLGNFRTIAQTGPILTPGTPLQGNNGTCTEGHRHLSRGP